VLTVAVGEAQAPKAVRETAAAGKSSKPGVSDGDDLAARIAFRFEILDLLTNHQFEGQKSSFHVE